MDGVSGFGFVAPADEITILPARSLAFMHYSLEARKEALNRGVAESRKRRVLARRESQKPRADGVR